jgi:Uma2 family endonuclease
MAIVSPRLSVPEAAIEEGLPPLENGDHLDQHTYHARYEAPPEDFHAELIGGVVFVRSRVGRRHARCTALLNGWLGRYEQDTPGTEALARGTIILGVQDEPEPDASLRILPEYGGRTQVENEYLTGAPELLIEVASSTEAIDLHRKKASYEAAGIDEYIVTLLRGRDVRWFVLENGVYQLLPPGEDGILRSRRFPGLWLDPQALLRNDLQRLREVLEQGLASPEHGKWVKRLAEAGPASGQA